MRRAELAFSVKGSSAQKRTSHRDWYSTAGSSNPAPLTWMATDGPEEVRLEGGRLQVRTPDGALAWESPVSWLVVDAALGDPDWDGRPDLVAIFWKADEAGVLRSHPFLIRQNGGRYEEVWGGSAVSEPIWEVEVTDLNGDGLDELVVLAMAPGAADKRSPCGSGTVGASARNGAVIPLITRTCAPPLEGGWWQISGLGEVTNITGRS